MTFQIRPATLEDAPVLAQLIREIGLFQRINQEAPEETLLHVTQEMTLCFADHSHTLWVAVSPEGEILGYCAAHWLPYLIHAGPEGYVSELFLREAARGQGIGSALLDTAVEEGRRRGCRRMALLNMRDRESYQREFYKKQGWEERADAANFVLKL